MNKDLIISVLKDEILMLENQDRKVKSYSLLISEKGTESIVVWL
jgi:hypothetical protein